MAPLTDEEIEIVVEFTKSSAAEALFAQLEGGAIADWITCDDAKGREACWLQLQAILLLKNNLRDAAAMKRLTERAQERRTFAP